MSNVAKQWYKDYKKLYDKNIDLFNTDIPKCVKEITGFDVSSTVWRYLKIHGAVERMGGFANFRHYVNKCADDDYQTFSKLEKQLTEANEFTLKLSRELDEHPKDYNGPCECSLCLSYGDNDEELNK